MKNPISEGLIAKLMGINTNFLAILFFPIQTNAYHFLKINFLDLRDYKINIFGEIHTENLAESELNISFYQ